MKSNLLSGTSKNLIFFFAISLLFASCYGDTYWGDNTDRKDCLFPSGGQSVLQIDPGSFSTVILDDSWARAAAVTIEKGDSFSIRLEAVQNVLDAMQVHTQNGILSCEMTQCFNGTITMKAHIVTPNLERVSNLAWAPNITISGFSGNSFVFENNNYSTVDLDINYQSVNLKCPSSCRLVCTGTAKNLDVNLGAGAGMAAFGLEAENADITSNIIMDIEVTATKTLNARILSSGDIRYKGHPEVSEAISGTGKVIDAN